MRVRPRFRLPNGKGSRLFLLPFRIVVRSRCIVLFLPWHASISTHGRPYGALEPRASKEEETPLRCVARARRLGLNLVRSELSTVWCDRALGCWIAGTRASCVDGELPWRCCGRWTMRWTAVKGSRDRSSCRAVAVASTPRSRAQAATEGASGDRNSIFLRRILSTRRRVIF